MNVRFLLLGLFLLLSAARAWTQVSNDDFEGRIALTGANAVAVSNLQTATLEPGEPNHANASGGRSLWWTWTAPASGTVNFSTFGGGAMTNGAYPGTGSRALAVYTGNTLMALTEVASAAAPTSSPVIYSPQSMGIPTWASCNAQVTAGTVYQIALDGPLFLNPGDDGTVVLAINQAPTIYSPAGASGTVGASFTYTVQASNNPTGFNATGLPPGLSINPYDGNITGTPSAAGAYTVNLAAANAADTGAATLTLAIAPAPPAAAPSAPVIDSSAAAGGVVGASFSYSIYANGSVASYSASNLPPGLSIDTTAGLISGVPTAAGVFNVPVTAANAVGTGTATIAFRIAAAPSVPVITSALTATGTVGSSFSYSIYTTGDYGGGSPTAYGASNLPPGLGFDPNSSTIKGTPVTAGVYSVPITAANAGGAGSAVVTISIAAATPAATPQAAAPQLSSQAVATGTVGTVFSYALAASNLPTGFAASNLPQGLSLNPTTGYLTGTPTSAGVFLVPVSASNAYGTSNGTLTILVTVGATTSGTSSPLVITSPAAAGGVVGQAMTYAIGAVSNSFYGPLPYGSLTYTVSNLPPGLSLNATYGTISGAPTTAGTFTAAITAAPVPSYTYLGTKGTAVVTFVIAASGSTPTVTPVFTSAAEVTSTVGVAFSGTTVFAASGSPTSYAASGLPPGLTLNTSNGTLSGSPTTAGTFPVSISATNGAGTGTATITYVIAAQAAAATPLLNNGAFTVATLGASFYYTLSASVSVTGYSVSNLPPGLSFSASNSSISGTPTATGLYPVPVSATTASGTINDTLTINVLNPVTLPVISSAATVRGTVGTSLTYAISAGAGSNNPVTTTAGTLPPGLAFSNGTISGTPTATGVYQVPVSATNGAGTTNATVTFTITAPVAPVFSGFVGTSGTVGTPFSYSIYAYNSPTSYTASNLPPGLSFSAAYFSGTPTTAGVYQVPVSAANAGGTANATLTITIANAATTPPVVSSAAAAAGVVNSAFSYTLTAINSPTSFGLGTSAPPGLSFNPTTGVLSGTPTTAGTYTLPVTATNAGGTGGATVTLNFAAQPLGIPVITSAAGANFFQYDSSSYYITATNQPTNYSASGLPAGVTLNSTTGLISGTLPNSTTSSWSVTITATNSVGQGTATLIIQQSSSQARITSAVSAGGVVGTAFSYNVTTNYPGVSYSASGLPPGLSLNTSTGLISGSPTTAGTYTASINAGTNGGGSGLGKVVFAITTAASPKPLLTGAAGAYGAIGDPFSYYLSAINSPTSLSVTNLPPGLNFDSSQGLISGAPTSSGTYNVGLSATNAAGTTNATLTLTVINLLNGSSRISSAAAVSATVGVPFSYTVTLNKPLTYTLSTPTGLPTGLICNAASLTITGTPAAAGTYVTKLNAANPQGFPASGYLTINVAAGPTAPPVISSAAAVAGTPGAAFSYTLAASNLPTSFAASNLPNSLSIDTATGIISGTPTMAGTFTVPVSATNSAGTGSATLTLVFAAAAPSLAGNPLTVTATVGVKTLAYRIAATNLPTSYAASGLPPGLSLDPSSGAISGTPTAIGTYQTTLSAANAYGSASAVVAFTISGVATAPVFSTVAATLTGSVGASFSASLFASGTAVAYAASGLPPGLYFDTGAGQIFGAPTTAGSYVVNVSATNAVGSDSAVLTLLIASAPVLPAFSTAPAMAAGSVGAPFVYTFYTNNTAAYAISGLPPGLSYTTSSGYGSFHGTPTTAGVYPVTISLGNAAGTVSAVATLVITNTPAALPVLSSAAGAGGKVGVTFRYQIAASNTQPTAYQASGLPDGLQVNVVTGVIVGTPTTAGNYPVTISATNSGGTASAVTTLQIVAAPAAPAVPLISSAAAVYYIPGAVAPPPSPPSTFSYTITASGSPTSFGAGTLPAGLSINPYTGAITGSPAAAGTFAVPVSATNATGTGTAVVTIMIPDAPPLLSGALVYNAKVGSPVLDVTDPATSAVYSYYPMRVDTTTFVAAGLPPGLSLNGTTGDIAGTPSQAGVFPVTLSATNRAGTSTAVITFNVTAGPVTPVTGTPPVIGGNASAQGAVGGAFSYYLYGGTSNSATGLPAGLSLNASTGKISGVPTASGVYLVPVSATNAYGTSNATLTINIATAPLAPIIASAAAETATVGVPFVYAIYTDSDVNSAMPTSYGAGTLPGGLNLDPGTGFITGSPTVAGLYSVPISVSGAAVTGNAILTVNVLAAPATPAASATPILAGSAGTLGFTDNPFLYPGTVGFTPDQALPDALVFNLASGSISGYPDDPGSFDVPLSAANAGTTGHAVVKLRVVTPGLSLPRIVVQPAGGTVVQGQGAVISAAVAGEPMPSLQWMHNGNAVPGATDPELSLSAVQSADAGTYTLSASNSSGRVTTSVAVLSVVQTYDNWQSTYFSSEEIAAGDAADGYDFDGDGLPNLLDYAFGIDPRTGLGGNAPSSSSVAGGSLQLQFTRDAGKTDIDYIVEASSDLSTWTPIARSTAGHPTAALVGSAVVTETVTGGSLEAVTVQDAPPTGSGDRNFLRLRVNRP